MLPYLNTFTKQLDKLKRISVGEYQQSVKKAKDNYDIYLSAQSELDGKKSFMCIPQIKTEEAKVDNLYVAYKELKRESETNLILMNTYIRSSEQANHSLIELQQRFIHNLALVAVAAKDILHWDSASYGFGGFDDN